MLALLSERNRNFALLKLAGYSSKETGVQLDFAERTVERGLKDIRETWTDSGYAP